LEIESVRSSREDGTASPLVGQATIVTGAGRGIGRAIAEELARAGAHVALVARSADELDQVAHAIKADKGRAVAFPGDVTDERTVEALVHDVVQTVGPPTLLVNNAGSWAQVGPVAESDPTTWWRDVEVSLKGTYLCSRAVLPGMLERSNGRIVMVASYAAITASPFMTAYACAKTAVIRFTDSLAAELESSGVRVFCISPGLVRTALVEKVARSEEGRRFLPRLSTRDDELEPERAARLVVDIASGRLDPLAGRFLHVLDDVDDLLDRADELARHDLYSLRLRTTAPP
jgi:NAD(P)-dependent dehydrogenase (short-subunit alcohol dehydrogenase family)